MSRPLLAITKNVSSVPLGDYTIITVPFFFNAKRVTHEAYLPHE